MSDRPTIRDVAKRAGVSIATVSRVLNDKGDVSAQTRDRVREVARSLGYSADWSARALATQQTRVVAIVVGDNAGHRDLSLIFLGKVLAAISHRLAQSSYDACCSSRSTSTSTTVSTPPSRSAWTMTMR